MRFLTAVLYKTEKTSQGLKLVFNNGWYSGITLSEDDSTEQVANILRGMADHIEELARQAELTKAKEKASDL